MPASFQQSIQTLCKEQGFPSEVAETFLGFCKSYQEAIDPLEPPLATFATFVHAVARQFKLPFHFAPFHKAIRAPVDYYQLGLDFIRPLIDFAHSEVSSTESLQDISASIARKENVVLLANHQTEIDPQIISLLLEKEYPDLAVEMIFMAGHRVVTDPLAVPLSLGRNLLCIYSKRHIDHPPEKKGEKLLHNQRALKVLEELLNEGGKCIYIAPSGGRDRADEKGIMQVAPFDSHAVEMFYLISQKAKRPTHFHGLALRTYPLLPPPNHVLVEIGEQRRTSFAPASLSFSDKIDMEHIANCHLIADKKVKRRVRAEAIWQQIATDYSKFN